MLSFKTLFCKYLEPNCDVELVENIIQTRAKQGSIYFKEKDELIFLYRQARIYNIESELEISTSSPSYQEKRKKIVRFFELIELGNTTMILFKYSKGEDKFILRNFLGFYAQLSVLDNNYISDILGQTSSLFDAESASEYCLHFIEIAKEENKDIPEIIKIVLETNVDKVRFKDYFTYLNSHMVALNDQSKRNQYYFLFSNINYVTFCLTNKSKSFLLLADELENDLIYSTFVDFSIISLQYYKVIEVELKDKFIRPVCEKIHWGKFYIEKKYYFMDDFDFNQLSLGEINLIFDNAYRYFTNANNDCVEPTNKKIYSLLKNLCNENVDYLKFYADITSKPFRNKFRNPSAHTEPLEFESIEDVYNIFLNYIDNGRKLFLKLDESPTRFGIIDKILNS